MRKAVSSKQKPEQQELRGGEQAVRGGEQASRRCAEGAGVRDEWEVHGGCGGGVEREVRGGCGGEG